MATDCATRVVTVSCLPHTRPARGLLNGVTPPKVLQASDFCRASGSAHADWLPPEIGDAHQLVSAASGCLPCPTNSLLEHHGVGATPLAECLAGSSYRVLQCLPRNLLPAMTHPYASPQSSRSSESAASRPVDVLLVHSDNRGHGFFAMVERVANQILYARSANLEPLVMIGPHVFAEGRACEHGAVPYYDASHGSNVWEYFFEQPSRHFASSSTAGATGRVAIRSVQVVLPESLYALALPQNHTMTYVGGASYDGPRRYALREAAHQLFRNGSLVRSEHRQRAEAIFTPWRRASQHILGVHVRGTDKVVARKVPPEAYFPFIDAWVEAHADALIVVASDEQAYHARLVQRYGPWETTGSGRGCRSRKRQAGRRHRS